MPLRLPAGFSLIPQGLTNSEAMSMKTQLQLESELLEGTEDGKTGGTGDLESSGRVGLQWGGSGGDIEERCAQAFLISKEVEASLVGFGAGDGAVCGGVQFPEQGRILGNGAGPEGKVEVKIGGLGGDGASADGSGESDESVLKRLNAGEQRAMGELWGRYAGLLFSQALRVLHNPAEAEDVVVEVFSEVWRRAGGYHPERARPAAWLVTLVRRRAIDRFRERRSHERAEERLAMERGGGRDSNDGIEEQVRLSELRRLLEQALKRLPERQREAVCMVYFEGLTQREISKRTRTPIGTVKTRLELGLRKMRERIRGARLRPRREFGMREECFSVSTEA